MAGIYIHIPFCRQKCSYCNFYSLASSKHIEDYISTIKSELTIRRDYLKGEEVETIYFGGGTPTRLAVGLLENILETVFHNYSVVSDPEITIEANPDDLNKKYLADLKKISINRLSIGIQSFFDDDLTYLNRVHNAEQSHQAIKEALDAGFSNIGIDLIYGIPTLTITAWSRNLEIFQDYRLPHLSAYALTVEPRTALHHHIAKGIAVPPDDETAIAQYDILRNFMDKAGYQHYEISNFCLDGYISKHNSNYWQGVSYLGAGPSAHSFDGESRQWNVSNITEYIGSLKQGIVPNEIEFLSPETKYNEYILTSLRTMWGCDHRKIKNLGIHFYNHFQNELQTLTASGMVFSEGNKTRLTQQGQLFADRIAATLFIEEAE